MNRRKFTLDQLYPVSPFEAQAWIFWCNAMHHTILLWISSILCCPSVEFGAQVCHGVVPSNTVPHHTRSNSVYKHHSVPFLTILTIKFFGAFHHRLALCDSLCKYCSKYLMFRSTFLVINHRCEIHCPNKPLGHKFSKAGDHNQLAGVINAKIIACYSSLQDHHHSNLSYKSQCWFFVQILLQIFVQINIFGHKFHKVRRS